MEIPFGNTDLNFSESLNNPGSLSDLTNDTYALGKINNLNVYKSAEEGIAALCNTLERIQAAGARTVSELISGFVDIVGNLVRTKTTYTNLRKEAYLDDVKNIWGIDSWEVIDLNDPTTKIIMSIIVTELVQQRNIYSYSQFVKGCSLAAKMDSKEFERRVTESSLSIEKSSGFNSPANSSIVKGGSSLANSSSSNYKPVDPTVTNFQPVTSNKESTLISRKINYDLRNEPYAPSHKFPVSEASTSLPAVLVNRGFRQNKIIEGEVVYLNDAGDKVRKLDNQTYVITYVDGSPDEVVKSNTTVNMDYTLDKNIGTISNSYSVETQKTQLEKRIIHMEKSNYPSTTKPLSTAQTILAAYRFR